MREYYLNAVSSLDGAVTLSLQAMNDSEAKLVANKLIAYYSTELRNELRRCVLLQEINVGNKYIRKIPLEPETSAELEAEEKAIADMDAKASKPSKLSKPAEFNNPYYKNGDR